MACQQIHTMTKSHFPFFWNSPLKNIDSTPTNLSRKGKWPDAADHVHINFRSSHRERYWGTRRGDNKRWQIGSLATCVPRHLQVVVAFTLTGRPTVEARGSIVHSVTSHLAKLVVWRDIPSSTVGRNHTSAINATIQPILIPLWETTLGNTLERNHTSAINVTLLQSNQAIWSSTKEPTLGKGLTDAQCASFTVLELRN